MPIADVIPCCPIFPFHHFWNCHLSEELAVISLFFFVASSAPFSQLTDLWGAQDTVPVRFHVIQSFACFSVSFTPDQKVTASHCIIQKKKNLTTLGMLYFALRFMSGFFSFWECFLKEHWVLRLVVVAIAPFD